MIQPLVSVIIPVFNSEKYLNVAIASVLDQTYKNLELLLVDDGSTDESLAIAQGFASEKVKVLHQQNAGASAARNKGLNEAKGEYIQFLDADDLIAPEKIAFQLELLQTRPGYICTGPTVYFQDTEDFFQKKPAPHWIENGSDDIADFLIKLYGGDLMGPLYGGMIPLHSWLCPRSVLDKTGEWNEDLNVDDDGEYFCRVVLASKGVLYRTGAISYYRKYTNKNSLSSLHNEQSYRSAIKAIDLKLSHLIRSGINRPMISKVFARLYKAAEVATYPQFKELSGYAGERSKKLGKVPSQYQAGPVSTFLSKLFGWRLLRRIDYFRHGK